MIKEAMRVRNAPTDKYRTIVALLLASGIRVGELVALRCGDDGEHSGWNQENSALAIRTTLWNGVEQSPKTLASIRMVDLSAPVNEMLAAYAKALNKNRGLSLLDEAWHPHPSQQLRQVCPGETWHSRIP
jgi:integrase